MNWGTFIPDLIVALIATGFTLGVALITFFWERRQRNRHLAYNLADDLAARRALAKIDPVEGGGDGTQFERCLRSVQSAQTRIAQIRDEIRPNDDLRRVLHRMAMSCVRYKHRVGADADRWQFALMDLRQELIDGLADVAGVLGMGQHILALPGTTPTDEERPSRTRTAHGPAAQESK